MAKRLVDWIPAGVWMLVLFLSSSTVVVRSSFVGALSSVAAPVASTTQVDHFWDRWWWLFVKGWHVTEFFVLTLLLVRAVRSWGVAACVALAYAASDEYHQSFVAHRGGRWTDVVIDALGVFLAGVVLATWKRSSRVARWQPTCPELSRE